MQPTGYKKHVQDAKTKSQIALNTIKRFDSLDTNIKLHLIKACVLPILTYPAYTLNALTDTQLLTLQRQQNKALRFAHNIRYPYTTNTEALHNISNVQPINIKIYKMANNITNKLTNILKDKVYKNSIEQDDRRDHAWFKRPIRKITNTPPTPLYT